MGVGFIRDKLEIKFLILYIAARVSEPLPLEGMQELTMCDDGIDYFAFSECLADLVKTEHLRRTTAATPSRRRGCATVRSASRASRIPCASARTRTWRPITKSSCAARRCVRASPRGKTGRSRWSCPSTTTWTS